MSLQNVYESGRTRRYHANPLMAHLGQTVADHSWGMIALLFTLHHSPSVNLIGAVTFHDSEERWIGDIPFPFKSAAPDLVKRHEEVGQQFCRMKGIPQFSLTEEEEKWLKFLDRLEAYMFAKLHGALDEEWVENNQILHSLAAELGVQDVIINLLH